MSVVQEDVKQPAYTTMPCGFEEEFVDFESAAHEYSISSCATDEWAISELDDEALGIASRTVSSGSGGSRSATTTTTGWSVYIYLFFLFSFLCFHSAAEAMPSLCVLRMNV
jgi:hypothetical protein